MAQYPGSVTSTEMNSSFETEVAALSSDAERTTPTVLGQSGGLAMPGARNGSAARIKVLVADDEQIIANTLAAILNMSGFEARAVYNGRTAIESLDSFQFDVFISDVVMPDMTGIEAAIAILEQCPECKVVLFSGQAATADLLIAARAKGHNFEILAKPVHPSDLLRKLRAAEFATSGVA